MLTMKDLRWCAVGLGVTYSHRRLISQVLELGDELRPIRDGLFMKEGKLNRCKSVLLLH